MKWFEVSVGEPSNLERCREERCSRGQERCRRGAGEVRRGAGEVRRGAMQSQLVTTSDSFVLKNFLHSFAFVLKWFEVSSGEPSKLERCREERCSRGQERCRRGAGEVRRGAGIFICYEKMAGVKVALSWYKTPT